MALSLTHITAADGATLGFHSVGTGPGLVIVHGAMQSAVSQRELALSLAGTHTVHLLDRRGRGASDSTPARSTAVEVDDLLALVAATDSHHVFGVSSGAIIAARAALGGGIIRRLALFEPPLAIDGSVRLDLIPRCEAALNDGDLPRAMAVAMKVAEMGPSWMFGLPTPLLAAVSKRMLATDDAKKLGEGEVHLRQLSASLRADFTVVRENADRVADFHALSVPTLLIDGTHTRPYLRKAVTALTSVIPDARHAELAGLNHAATQNRAQWGHPDVVASPLLEFFALADSA